MNFDKLKTCIHNRHFPNNISLYIRNKLGLRHGQTLDMIEIEITSLCNIGCINCDRSCGKEQAPTDERMTVQQIQKFIDQSIDAKKRWHRITVLGGEPTVHPDFMTIVNLLSQYKESYNPYTSLLLVTNGYGQKAKDMLPQVPSTFTVKNTAKTSKMQKEFKTYTVAPCDLAEYADADYSKGCSIALQCGLALTRYGYYLCGAGASVDRVFGFGLGVRALAQVTKSNMVKTREQLCRLCGHFKSENTDLRTSPTWKKAYSNYAARRPDLPLF